VANLPTSLVLYIIHKCSFVKVIKTLFISFPGNVIVPGMAEPVNEKMVYHQHHVHHQQHLLPSQQLQQQQGTSRVHGWYDHNSSQMHQQQQPHGGPQMMGQQHHPHFIHDPHHQVNTQFCTMM
jgi:hypothetical protein